MKISIITPAFNPGKLILETFISLQNQTFKDFEWIIIDDCSDEMNKALFQQINLFCNYALFESLFCWLGSPFGPHFTKK